ncbi:hypothetical protein QE372_001931 [Agrobacterium pusense]|nr:hypothetical protein [Agrobacterium pusense]
MIAVLPGGRQTWRKPRDGPGGGTLATFVERTMSQGAVHGPCEIRHGERPGCATHPTHTKPNQCAAGQSPDISSDHPFGRAVRDEAVGVLGACSGKVDGGGCGLPPLPCRASLPQGGRSICGKVSTISKFENEPWESLLPISPLEGEMPGRAEWVTPHALRPVVNQPPENPHPVTNPSDSCATD